MGGLSPFLIILLREKSERMLGASGRGEREKNIKNNSSYLLG